MNNHLTQDELILHSYGEIDRADRARVDEHLAACMECQLAKEQLARVMTMIDTASPVEAPLGFERTAWARLEPELDRHATSAWRTFFWFPQWAFAGGMAALLIAAFVAGRVSGGDPAAPANAVAHVEPSSVLQSAVG